MPAPNDTQLPPQGSDAQTQAPAGPGRMRVLSTRWAAALAAAMLGVGVAAGAAIGPAPAPSLAGGVAERLPLLLASLGSHSASTAAAPAPKTAPATPATASTPAAASIAAPETASTSTSAPASEETTQPSKAPSTTRSAKGTLPATTSVWLIQLAGTGFDAAAAQPAAAPYITSQLLPGATLLSGWTALQASAFASEAALAEAPPAGSPPPILHSIVQPPCPEGPAGASCAPETPGQLTAADEFLKATLATITSTASYKEHGLIVVTFATVGIATQSELPAGTVDLAAHLPAARRRRPALPLRQGRRPLERRLQPDFTQAEPRKAPALRKNSQHQRTNGDPVAPQRNSPP